MLIEIKAWTDGRLIYSGEFDSLRLALEAAVASRADLSRADLSGAYLSRADLSGADLSRADLSHANLSRADLSRADLSGADLSGADLSRADLSHANLSGADLSGAYGLDPFRTTSLLMLLDQPGPIRAYKLVDADGRSPINDKKLTYDIGKSYEVERPNTNVNERCAAGINVATLDWCLREWREGWRIFVVEFTAADIAAIPTSTDGKFRLRRCTVVAEKDMAQYKLPEPEAKKATK